MEQDVLDFGEFLAKQPVNQLKRDIASFADGYLSAMTMARSLAQGATPTNTTPTPAQTSADLITSTLTPSVKS